MLRKIRHHYTQSVQAHALLGRVLKAPGLPAKLDLLRQVKEINKGFDPNALPKRVTKTLEWYIANVRPLLVPFGSHRPVFLMRIGLFLRRCML